MPLRQALVTSDRFLNLPAELIGHVLAQLDYEAVPAARLSCRSFCDAFTVDVWRSLITRIMRENDHLEADEKVHSSAPTFKLYAKMRYASSLRFFSDRGSQECNIDGDFRIPDFGGVSNHELATVDAAGRKARCDKWSVDPDSEDDPDNDFYEEFRAELQLTHLAKNPLTHFGPITFEIEMAGSGVAMHFIYLRLNGESGRTLYFFAPDGVHQLRVSHKKVKFIPDPSLKQPFVFNGAGESLHVRPDERLHDLDRQWLPGDLPSPGPDDDLYLGVTLFADNSTATLRRVIVHEGKADMEARIKQLEAEKKDLERQVQELKAKAEAIEKRESERRALEEKKHAEEVQFLKRTNAQLKKELETYLSPTRK